MPRRKRHKHFCGDIFEFPCDDKYGYALIIAKFSDIRKWDIISPLHPYASLMTVPLMVRPFNIVSDERVSLEILKKTALLNPQIITDNTVIYGEHPIVYHKELTVDDIVMTKSFEAVGVYKIGGNSKIDTPRGIEYFIEKGDTVHVILSWGFGMIKVSGDEVKANMPTFDTTPNYRDGVASGMGTWFLENEKRINEYEATIYKTVYDYFNLPYDISFDDFNSRFGGVTRQQYVDLLKEKNAL